MVDVEAKIVMHGISDDEWLMSIFTRPSVLLLFLLVLLQGLGWVVDLLQKPYIEERHVRFEVAVCCISELLFDLVP